MNKSKLKEKIGRYNQMNLEEEKRELKEKKEQEIINKFIQDKFVDKYGGRMWMGGFLLAILIAYFTAYTSFFNDGVIRFFFGLLVLIAVVKVVKFCLESKIKFDEGIK